MARLDAPGLFFFLLRDGVVGEAELRGLVAALPAEAIVATGGRDGEALDSTRWPVARDAALAREAAGRLGGEAMAAALAEIDQAGGELEALRRCARASMERTLAGGSTLAHALVVAELGAAEGLYAYHAHRRLPGPGAEAAAMVVAAAIAAGRMTVAEVVASASALAGGVAPTPGDEFTVSRRSPAIDALAGRIVRACAEVTRVSALRGCFVFGDGFAFGAREGAASFVIAAGPRALLALDLTEDDLAWARQIARAAPAMGLREGSLDLVVPERGEEAGAEHDAAVVAMLRLYVDAAIEAHVRAHPEDEALFPALDDARIARIFG